MGAFLLYKNGIKNEALSRGKKVFAEKGFDDPAEYRLGGQTLLLYRKQLVPENNARSSGNRLLAAAGTPVYKGRSYSDSLDAIFEDLKKGEFDYAKMYGAYILLYYDGSDVRFIFDDMQELPVYSSADGSVISSSFLACANACEGRLTLNKMACLEKLCTGMVTGSDTLFNEITRGVPGAMKENHSVLSAKREGGKTGAEIDKQLACLYSELDEIAPLAEEFGADMGLSGGFDSRLLYGLLQKKFGEKLSAHTHCTRGAHEKEIRIAQELARLYGKEVNLCPTVPLQDMGPEETEETLKTNVLLFDGYSDSHYGTFSSTYSKNYRQAVCGGNGVLFTGLSGEIYRNYRKISKPVLTEGYFDAYVFYCHYRSALKDKGLADRLQSYVTDKAFLQMGRKQTKVMAPGDVRRYNACVRLPYKASCAAAAFNQLCFYDAPCTHRRAAEESMAADRAVGDDSRLEAGMICAVDERFRDIPVTKADTTKIGDKSAVTRAKQYVFARLPMSVIKKRKLQNNETETGEQIVKQSRLVQEAVAYTKGLTDKDISLDCLIGNKNSYQNAIFLALTLFMLKDRIDPVIQSDAP